MPQGQPTPDQILQREVSFFSIDTNILEGKGFDFKRGALNVLQHQRPTWMTLQLSEIVEREVQEHRMRELGEANQKLLSALNHMSRKASLDTSQVQSELNKLKVPASAEANFKEEMKTFIGSFGGSVLPIEGNNLAKELFDRYFLKQSPFEVIKDKKSEFPDAAALLTLEHYAKDSEGMGLLISKDRGWQAFAADSKRLFCISSLEEFTAITEKIGGHVATLEEKVRDALSDETSQLFKRMEDAMKNHIASSNWSVDEIHTGSSLRVEAEVYETELVTVEPQASTLQGWLLEDSPYYTNEFEVKAQVKVLISAQFFYWDSIDREEISAGTQEFEVPMEIEVSVFITSNGQLVADPVDAWNSEFEIADENYAVDVGEVDLDLSDGEYD